jgi:hypothetical protein
MWYAGRLLPEWRKRSLEETAALFAVAGLDGEFWKLS